MAPTPMDCAWISLFLLTLFHYGLALVRSPWPFSVKLLVLALIMRWPFLAFFFWGSCLFHYLAMDHPSRRMMERVAEGWRQGPQRWLGRRTWLWGAGLMGYGLLARVAWVKPVGFEKPVVGEVQGEGFDLREHLPWADAPNLLERPEGVWQPAQGLGRLSLGKLDLQMNLKQGAWSDAALLWERPHQIFWINLNKTSSFHMEVENRLRWASPGRALPLGATCPLEYASWKWERLEGGCIALTFKMDSQVQPLEVQKVLTFPAQDYTVAIEHQVLNASDATWMTRLETDVHWRPQPAPEKGDLPPLAPPTLNLFTDHPGVTTKRWLGLKTVSYTLPSLFEVEEGAPFKAYQGSSHTDGWAAWAQRPFVWFFQGENEQHWKLEPTELEDGKSLGIQLSTKSKAKSCLPQERCHFQIQIRLGPLESDWIQAQGGSFSRCFDARQQKKRPLDFFTAHIFAGWMQLLGSAGLSIILLGVCYFLGAILPVHLLKLLLKKWQPRKAVLQESLGLLFNFLSLYLEIAPFLSLRKCFRYALEVWGCPFLWERSLSGGESYGFFFTLYLALTLLQPTLAQEILGSNRPGMGGLINPQDPGKSKGNLRRKERFYSLLMATSFSLSRLGGTAWGREHFPFCPNDFSFVLMLLLMSLLYTPPASQQERVIPLATSFKETAISMVVLVWMGRSMGMPVLLFQIGRRAAELVVFHPLQAFLNLKASRSLIPPRTRRGS